MIETIALVLTGLSITASIVYYANILSNANKNQKILLEKRELDQFMSLYQQVGTQESWERYVDVTYNLECKDFAEFLEKYGPTTNPKQYARICSLWYDFVVMGDLVYIGTFSIEQVSWLVADMPIRVWEKWGPIIEELRDHIGSPIAYTSFEYLVSELRKIQYSEKHSAAIDQMRKSINNP